MMTNQASNKLRAFWLLAFALFVCWWGPQRVEAATWTDPNLDQSIKLSKFIGVIEATTQIGPQGDHTLMFQVVETWKSSVEAGKFLELGGHFDSERQDAPKIPAKQRFVAFLDFRQQIWTALTPSIGLLPIKDTAALAITRDTSLRFPVRLSKYRRFIKSLISNKADPGLLKECRTELGKKADLVIDKNQVYAQIFALEYLVRFAEPVDLKILSVLLQSKFYQVRASAVRAMGRLESVESVESLIKLTTDGQTLVSAWAGFTLLRKEKIPESCYPAIVSHCRSASDQDVKLAENVTDPRRNRLPACKTSLLRLIGRQKIKAGQETLKNHLSHDDVDVVKAALAGFTFFEDPGLAEIIIEAMPETPERQMLFGRLFQSALFSITKARAGRFKSDWQAWLKKQKTGQ